MNLTPAGFSKFPWVALARRAFFLQMFNAKRSLDARIVLWKNYYDMPEWWNGKRNGLKIRRVYALEGSSPSSGTKKKTRGYRKNKPRWPLKFLPALFSVPQ